MIAACTKFVILENVRCDDPERPEPVKNSPSILSQLRTILHTWFRLGRNTEYFCPTEPLSIQPHDWKYLIFLPKRNQVCRIVLSCDKVILGEVLRFWEENSGDLSKSLENNFSSEADRESERLVKWDLVHICWKWTTQNLFFFGKCTETVFHLSTFFWNYSSSSSIFLMFTTRTRWLIISHRSYEQQRARQELRIKIVEKFTTGSQCWFECAAGGYEHI